MNQQPEALRIANEYRPTMGLDVVRLWAPDAVAELQRQHAEIEALRRDAERYRWLRDGNDTKGSPAMWIAQNRYGMEWDAAIDAAMEAKL